jgi:hypothetical protein
MKYFDKRTALGLSLAILLIIFTGFVKNWNYSLNLAILIGVAFIQNMSFTLVSRSRNSGDPDYHRYCAWGSNGIWFLCYMFLMRSIWADLMAGNMLPVLLVGAAYALATAEGSVLMMKIALRNEKGKRQVGSKFVERGDTPYVDVATKAMNRKHRV